jgi:hypothetical protein
MNIEMTATKENRMFEQMFENEEIITIKDNEDVVVQSKGCCKYFRIYR